MAAIATAPSAPPFDRRALLVRLSGAAAVLALLVLALSSLPGLDEVRAKLAGATPAWFAGALALELASCLAFVVAFRGVLRHRLPWRRSYDLGMAVQGANVLVPTGGAGGLAVGAWALRRTGMTAEQLARRSVAFFLLTSSVNFATAILAGGALALGILPGDLPLALTAGPAALAAMTMAAALALPRVLRRVPDRGGRVRHALAAASGALAGGVAEARTVIASRDGAVLAAAVGYMALDLAALTAAFAAIGSVPPLGVLLLAYVLGQLGGLLPLPGGVGGADSGVIGAFVLYGVPLPEAAAAVLAYRAFQLGLPAVLGAVALLRLPRLVSSISDDELESGASVPGSPEGWARSASSPTTSPRAASRSSRWRRAPARSRALRPPRRPGSPSRPPRPMPSPTSPRSGVPEPSGSRRS